MATELPEPLSLAWGLKPVSAAAAGAEKLPDGRTKLWVKHEVLKGVTPAMFVWWFGHLEGEVEIDRSASEPVPGLASLRSRLRALRAPRSGRLHRPGSADEACEVLAREPGCTIDVVSTLEKLDEDGFIHKVVVRGLELARMEHTFRATADGTLDENSLIVPGSRRLAFLSQVLVPWRFPEPKGRAWLKHSIEEMGSLENFPARALCGRS